MEIIYAGYQLQDFVILALLYIAIGGLIYFITGLIFKLPKHRDDEGYDEGGNAYGCGEVGSGTSGIMGCAGGSSEIVFGGGGADFGIITEAKAVISNEELHLLHRIEGLIADNQNLREALEMAGCAISTWVCLYAPDECAEDAVKAALVSTKAGVLWYTADVKREIRAALKQEPKT